MPISPFESLLTLPVSHVWFGDHTALFIELGNLTESKLTRRNGTHGNPCGQVTIMADCAWRIESKRSIVAGQGSAEKRLDTMRDRLILQRVESVSTLGVLPELNIHFTNNLRLLTFSRYEGQPDWSILFNSPKMRAVGVRAGRIWRESDA